MAYTLTYSEGVKGWPSFYSYIPEAMIGMNNRFYSFSGGNLFVHNSDNEDRNTFYGVRDDSSITGVVNDNPHDVKTFKTFVLESNSPWNSTFVTDLDQGQIQTTWYDLKEGDYYGYIRRNTGAENLDFRSAVGIGDVDVVDGAIASAVVLTFTFNISSIISIGDRLYRNNAGAAQFLGVITGIDGDEITINTTGGGLIPSSGDYVLSIKSSVAESYGATGYYLQYTLTNSSTDFVELFAIGSNLFKSYP